MSDQGSNPKQKLLKGQINTNFGSVSASSQSDSKAKYPEMSNKVDFYVTYIRPPIAEFFGQLIFTYLHCSTAHTVMTVPSVMGNPLLPAINDGLSVAILVILIGHISGAHVNFAVTTAVFIGGGLKVVMVPVYLVAQLLGSLAGAALSYVANGAASGEFALGKDVSIGQGVLMETMLTALLTIAVLLAAVELSTPNAAFAIGFSILIDILASFGVTGGCMNPSLSFGPAVVSGMWTNYWIYWVAPLLGALISATIFRLFLGGNARLLFRQTVNDPPGGLRKGLESSSDRP
uniref:Aquaporin-8 n=1 Tax=Phallusia mammillata TaxID=59560 RepID=A0A6F9D617_9ASCI|nr:aquaporin-8 [Phallusia mammillata]